MQRPGLVRTGAWLVGTVVLATVAPFVVGPSYGQFVLELAMVYVIATTGLNVAIGFSGQFQMAQAAFMAAGAYTTAILNVQDKVPFWLAAVAALGVVLVFGLVVALVSLRTRSHYLLLATFGLQLIAINVLSKLTITGGVNGTPAVSLIPVGLTDLAGTTQGYSILMIAVVGLGLLAADWLRYSYLGLGMQSSRQNERLVISAGLNPGGFRVLAVLISAVYGGAAGVLLGPILTYIDPPSFGLTLTLLLLLMVVVGGMGSVGGVAAAAILLTYVSQAAQESSTGWPLIYGLTIMAILALAPNGLGGAFSALRRLLVTRLVQRKADEPTSSGRVPSVPTGDLRVVRTPTSGSALELRDVHRHYGGVKAVDGISMRIEAGITHGLIGPNGSGKTTLFDLVCGFVRQDRGQIEALGRDVSRLPASARARYGVGRTFQHPSIVRDNTVLENVLLGVMSTMPGVQRMRPLLGAVKTAWEQQAMDALIQVGAEPLWDRQVRDLPYGQQRIVDIARVLAARPSLVLLDEPGAGMPDNAREIVRHIIRDLRDRGVTVVIVEHDMRLIMDVCDRITVLNTGKVIAEGTPDEIGRNESVVAAYLGERYARS